MENRIKDRQQCLFADRTSSAWIRSNQLRLYFSSFANVLMCGLRRLALEGTRYARAQCSTLRVRYLKIAAQVNVTTRRVSLSENYPWQTDFQRTVHRLKALPLGHHRADGRSLSILPLVHCRARSIKLPRNCTPLCAVLVIKFDASSDSLRSIQGHFVLFCSPSVESYPATT